MDDIEEIYQYSVNKWGESIAIKYIRAFENAFSLLKENQKLLKVNTNISSRFKIYAVKQHYLICDIIKDTIIVLTIKHVSMNLLEQLVKLEPNFELETKILFNKINN